MKLSQFKFNLPSELIALQPTQNRDEARLMVVDRKTGKIEHRIFKDLVDYVKDGDVFVINNTKVFPAKLSFCKPSEFFLFAFKKCANSFALLQTGVRRICRGFDIMCV